MRSALKLLFFLNLIRKLVPAVHQKLPGSLHKSTQKRKFPVPISSFTKFNILVILKKFPANFVSSEL